MKKKTMRVVIVLMILSASLLSGGACFAAESSTVLGNSAKSDPKGKGIIPAIDLPMPASEQAKRYLGLSGTGSFKIGQIKAPVLIIEVFSLY